MQVENVLTFQLVSFYLKLARETLQKGELLSESSTGAQAREFTKKEKETDRQTETDQDRQTDRD